MAVKAACVRTFVDIFRKRWIDSAFRISSSPCQKRSFVSVSQHYLSPQPPKRPVTAFLKFFSEKMPDIVKTNPTATIVERSKIASQMWQNLDPEVKNKMKLAANEEHQAYRMKYSAFLDGLSDQERIQLTHAKEEKKQAKITRKHKMDLRKFGRPKFPTNAFMLFVRSSRLERGSAHVSQFVKGLVEYWKKMPQEEKDIYIADAKAENEKYHREMLEWEERMREMGRDDLIRVRSRKKAPKITSTRVKKLTEPAGSKPKAATTTKAAATAKVTAPAEVNSVPAKVAKKSSSHAKVVRKPSSGTKKKVISQRTEE